jgi:hypothetical protein
MTIDERLEKIAEAQMQQQAEMREWFNRIAENQARAWEGIGRLTKDRDYLAETQRILAENQVKAAQHRAHLTEALQIAAEKLQMVGVNQVKASEDRDQLAKAIRILAENHVELRQGLAELRQLIERFIRAQHNGRNGGQEHS